ncbi:MAG: DUF3347 domain-containing protein [Bacteroidota bacterium]
MKQIIILSVLLLTLFVAQAQKNATPLLTAYYEMKDALVAADAATAAAKATEFNKQLASTPKAKEALQVKLSADAEKIAGSKDVAKQRDAFATLSANMLVLAKTEKLSADPIYQQYCPMKKTYWLSYEPAIKNPYYGKMMLTCGSVTETIKP